MPAPYESINGTLLGENLSYILVYANSVTEGWFTFFMVLGFFILVLVSSLLLQFRFSARIRFETSLAASSFATLGFAVILKQTSGLLNNLYFQIIIGICILSVILLYMSSDS